MSRRRVVIIIAVVLVLLCLLIFAAGCSLDSEETPAQLPEATNIEIVEIVVPTETPPLEPTNTTEPTNTPEPTRTPYPTHPPRPTSTPTPIPDPVILTGSGDSVIDFNNPFGIAIARITGNTTSRHFSIVSYDSSGEYISLLVSTSDPYEGVVLMDINDTHSTRFEVSAVGDWTIEVRTFLDTRTLVLPGVIEGSGDDVIILLEGPPDLATIRANEASKHFSIVAFGQSSVDLLVSTSDPYEGTVMLENDALLLSISAVGDWYIAISK